MPSLVFCPVQQWDDEKVDLVATSLASESGMTNKPRLEVFLRSLSMASSYSGMENITQFVSDNQGLPEPHRWLDLALQVRQNLSVNVVDEIQNQIRPLEFISDVGFCYALNSLVAYSSAIKLEERAGPPPPGIIRHVQSKINTNTIVVSLNYPYKFYVQAPDDLPDPGFITATQSKEKMMTSVHMETSQIASSPALSELNVRQRKCRFGKEVLPKSLRPRYTRSMCLEQCRVRLAHRFCGCRPFFANFSSYPICDVRGMTCLQRNSGIFLMNLNLTSRERFDCKCLPACNRHLFRVMEIKEDPIMQGIFTTGEEIAKLFIETMSKTRIRRDVLFTIIDLTVSFGGAVGLFLGVSLLSALEILYYCTLRLYFHPDRRNII